MASPGRSPTSDDLAQIATLARRVGNCLCRHSIEPWELMQYLAELNRYVTRLSSVKGWGQLVDFALTRLWETQHAALRRAGWTELGNFAVSPDVMNRVFDFYELPGIHQDEWEKVRDLCIFGPVYHSVADDLGSALLTDQKEQEGSRAEQSIAPTEPDVTEADVVDSAPTEPDAKHSLEPKKKFKPQPTFSIPPETEFLLPVRKIGKDLFVTVHHKIKPTAPATPGGPANNEVNKPDSRLWHLEPPNLLFWRALAPIELAPRHRQVLSKLSESETGRMRIQDLADSVWQRNASELKDKTIAGTVSKLNSRLAEENIPISIEIKKGYVTLSVLG